jgi:5'(3')-deoxyribonucleotidase
LLWVQAHLGDGAHKRLILTHNKNLNMGDFLIDDQTNNGSDGFGGEHVHFGSGRYPDWPSVMEYMRSVAAEA